MIKANLPGPKGLPEYIEINFGVTDPADKQPGDPVMYIIPVRAYEEMWTAAGNDSVVTTINSIFNYSVSLPIHRHFQACRCYPMKKSAV